MVTDVPIISADSHITEPPDTYTARIDARFRDRAPRLVRDAKLGDLFVIDGLDKPIPMGLVAAAGKPAEDLAMFGARFEDLHRGGWDPEARLADQVRDGVSAEVLYPTVGIVFSPRPTLTSHGQVGNRPEGMVTVSAEDVSGNDAALTDGDR
jgi:hypothetical protein